MILRITWLLRSPLPPPKVLGSVQLSNDGRLKGLFGSLVTDGSRLYFGETLAAGGFGLAQITTTGGETVLIPIPFPTVSLTDTSPNGSELLITSRVGSEGALWVLPVLGGSPRRLGNVVAFGATWTPDGQKITYSHGSEIYLSNKATGEARKLVTTAGSAGWLRWSPDGSVLRFTLQDIKTTSNSLWEVSANGGGDTQVEKVAYSTSLKIC